VKHTTVLLSLLVLALVSFAPAQESLGVRLVGCCSAVVDPCGVVLQGDYAYVADGASGRLRVISVKDPAHPVQVGSCYLPGISQQDVAVSGDYAYVADYDLGLGVISIADPANPVEVGYCDTPDRALDVALNGGYAYVADFTGGLRVVSVADPSSPVEVGEYSSGGSVRGVVVCDSYAYVAAGLQILSIADPANPTEVGYCQIPDCAWAVAVESGYAYVAAGGRGLRVVSVADPAHPVEVGYRDTPDNAWSVAVSGESAYVADAMGGLRVISVADSAHPVEVGYYVRDAGLAHGVAVRGGYIYVGDGGLRIYQSYVPGVEETPNAKVRTANSMPTVVRGALVLGAADSRQNTGYRAELLDVCGRKVVELRSGANDVRALAPGVYFVRAVSREPSAVSCHKVVIAR
jgi:hypothetical protein